MIRRNFAQVSLRIALLGCLLSVVSAAPAASFTWDPNLTGTGSDNSGNWDTTVTDNFWASSGLDAAWVNSATSIAVFGAGGSGPQTVTLTAPITANGLVFNSGATYTIASSVPATNTLTLGGTTPSITVNSGMTPTISAIIAGTAGLTFGSDGNSADNITLTGANNYTGGTTINSGTVTVGTGGTLGAAANALVFGNTGGTLATSANVVFNTGATIASFNDTTQTATDTLQIANGNIVTVSGAFTVGQVVSNSTASMVLNSYSGAANSGNNGTGGELDVNGAMTIGANPGGANKITATVDLSALSTFKLNASATTLNIGNGTNIKGILTLATGSNSLNSINVTTINMGTSASGNANGGSALNLGGGGNNNSVFGNIINANTINIGAGKSTATISFQANATSTSSVLIAGTGNNTGSTSGARATILMDNETSGTGNGPSNLTLAGHWATVIANTVTVAQDNAGAGTVSANVTFDTGLFDVNSLVLANGISGSGAMTGNFTLGTNSSSTGVLNVNTSFILAQNKGASITAGNGTFTMNGGTANVNSDITDASTVAAHNSTFKLLGGTLNLNGHVIGSSTNPITNFFMPTGGNTATLENLGATGIWANGSAAGNSNSSGGINVNAGGTLILAGNNTYAGGTSVDNGSTLQLGSFNAAPNSMVTANNGNLSFLSTPGSTYQIGGLSSTNSGMFVSLNDNVSAPVTLQIGTQGGNFAGQFSGLGGITLSGTTGTTTLTLTNGSNNYSGNTTITGGTLLLSGGAQLYNGVGTGGGIGSIQINGGTLAVTGSTGTTAIGGNGITVNSGTLAPDSTQPMTVNNLALQGGTLQFTLNGSSLSEIIVNGGGTANLNIGSLSFATVGVATPNATPYTILDASAGSLINNLTFANPYTAGGVSFTVSKVGNTLQVLISGTPSTLTWVGANASGTWDVNSTHNWNNTTKVINPDVFHNFDSVTFDDTANPNFNVNITAAVQPGSLVFNNTTAHAYTISSSNGNGIGGTTGLQVNGGGQVTVNTVNTYAGNTTINSGTLIVGSTGTVPSANVSVNGGGILHVNGGGSLTSATGVTANVSSGGAFTLDSGAAIPATFNLTNNGATTFGSSQSITTLVGTDPTAVLSQSGTLSIANGNGNTYPGAIVDFAVGNSGGLTLSGGNFTLTGANTYTGNTTINSGATLQIDNGSGTGSLYSNWTSTSGSINNNGQLILNSSNTYAIGNAINGSGSLTQNGSGVVTLTGSNGYSGGTIINNGTITVNPGGTLGASNSALTLGTAAGGSSVGTLNINTSVNIGAISVTTNTTSSNTINIASGQTLTSSGALLVGFAPNGSNTNTNLTVTGTGGTFNINAGTGNFTVGVGVGNNTTNGNPLAVVDLSTLSNFSFTTSTGTFGVGSLVTHAASTVRLANTSNTITAATLTVGDSNQNSTGNNPSGLASTLFLGAGANQLNLNTINIGATKAFGTIDWQTTTGLVVINGEAGGTSTTAITIGRGTTSSATSSTSALNLAGHNATVQAGAVQVGVLAGSTNGSPTGAVTFDTGTFNASSVALAVDSSGASTGGSRGTFTLGTDSTSTGALNVTGGFFLTNVTTTAVSTHTDQATFTINGGTASLGGGLTVNGSATGVTQNTTVNLEGGFIDLHGNGIGSATAPVSTVNILDNITNPTANPTLTIANLGGIWASSGNLGSMSGSLIVPGGNFTVVLAGVNTYAGGTTINGGTLQVGSATLTGSLPSGGSVNNNGTLNFAAATPINDSSIYTGSGAIQQTGAGTTTLSGNSSSFGGTVAVQSGNLVVNGTLPSSTAVAVTGGTLSGSGTIVGDINVNGGAVHAGSAASPQGTLTSTGLLNFQTGGFSFAVGPTGSSLLSVQNAAFNGATPVISFTLSGTPPAGPLTVLTSANPFTGDSGLASMASSSVGRTTFTPHEQGGNKIVVNITGGPATLTWNNNPGGGDGSTWDVQGQQNWNSTAPTDPHRYYQQDNVVFNDANNFGFGAGQNPNAYNVQLNTPVTPSSITVNNSAGNYTIGGSGSIGGGTGLTKQGTGTLILADSGGNTYSGTTAIQNGTLQLGAPGVLPTGTALSFGNGSGTTTSGLDLGGNSATISSITENGGTNTIGNSSGAAATLTYAGSGTATFGGTVRDGFGAGGGQLALNVSTGSLTLTGPLSYTGNTAIGGGSQLQVSGSHTESITGVISGAGNLTVGDGVAATVLTLGGSNSYTGNTTISKNSEISTSTLANTGTVSGIGAGSAGTTLTLDGGTLQWTPSTNAVSTNRTITITPNGATLDVSPTVTSINTTLSGAITLSGTGSRTLTLTGTDQNPPLIAGQTLSSVLADPTGGQLSIVKNGSSGWVLSGANSFSGGIIINQGRIRVGNAGALGNSSGTVVVNNGASLYIPTAGTYNNNISIAGLGISENPTSQANNINFGALRLGAANVIMAGTITLTADARIGDRGGAAGTSITGQITGNHALELGTVGNGTGTMIIANTSNNWTGDTTIDSGIVKAGAASTATTGVIPHGTGFGNLVINGGDANGDLVNSTFDLNANNVTVNGLNSAGTASMGVITNTGATAATLSVGDNNANGNYGGSITNGSATELTGLTKIGSGTQTLSATSSYTGNTTISQGTLSLGAAGAIATTGQVVMNGGKLATGGLEQDFTTATLGLTGGGTSTLDLGSAASPTNVTFTNSTANTWSGKLAISNWTYGTDHLLVGSGGVLPAQLADIQFTDFALGAASLVSALNSGPDRSIGEITPLIGDVNGDGHVDVSDVAALMKALANPDFYKSARTTNTPGSGITPSPTGIFTSNDVLFSLDVNGDGVDNNADIQALLNYLIAGGGNTSPVPEPGAFVLLGLGSALLVAGRIRRKRASDK